MNIGTIKCVALNVMRAYPGNSREFVAGEVADIMVSKERDKVTRERRWRAAYGVAAKYYDWAVFSMKEFWV